MIRRLSGACVAAALTIGFATSAMAADNYTYGNYVNVQAIHTVPGQFEAYVEYLNGQFKRSEEFALSQGWTVSYRIMTNVNARKGEPDLFILREFKDMITNAESERRDKIMAEFTKVSDKQADAASGARGVMRELGSNTLLQEIKLK